MARGRRIAHVFPSHSWGGAEIYAVQLAAAQVRSGSNVVLWVPAGSRLEAAGLREGVPVITDPVPWRFSPTQLPRLVGVIDRCGLGVLHFHWSGGPWAFLGVGFFTKVRRIYHVHLWMKHSKKDPLHWILYRTVDLVIVAGNRARDRVLRLLPVSEKKVKVLPYAIAENPRDIPDRLSVRREVGLSEDAVVIGLFARRDRQKGYLELLGAVGELRERRRSVGHDSDFALLLVGDRTHGEEDAERYSEEIDALIAKSGFSVVSLPSQRNFQKYLAACDVLAVPSYHESYSLMILHAHSLGIPVMASNSGGTPDLVTPERGWLFEPESVSAIVNVLDQITQQSLSQKRSGLVESVEASHRFSGVVARLGKMIESLH